MKPSKHKYLQSRAKDIELKEKKFPMEKKQTPKAGGITGRKVFTGSHCEYVDICLIDRLAATGCNSGQKFVMKVSRARVKQLN